MFMGSRCDRRGTLRQGEVVGVSVCRRGGASIGGTLCWGVVIVCAREGPCAVEAARPWLGFTPGVAAGSGAALHSWNPFPVPRPL